MLIRTLTTMFLCTAPAALMAEGYLYTATNETENAIIAFEREDDGSIKEISRTSTGGKGTNGFNALTGAEGPDSITSSNSITLSDDNKILFAVNYGDSTVSSFAVGEDGNLTLIDTAKTGSEGPSSVAFNDADQKLYVSHRFGPNHVTTLSVQDGKMTAEGAAKSVNTEAATDRIPTQIIMTPDEKFAIVSVLFNARPAPGENGPVVTPSNADAGDGFVVFPIADDGTLGEGMAQDSGAPTPFAINFLNDDSGKFVTVYAAANGAGLGNIDAEGKITTSPLAKADDSAYEGKPLELCWISVSPDNKVAYGTSFGLGQVMSFGIEDNKMSLINQAAAEVPATNEFKAFAGVPTSGAADQWMSDDGYLYQIFPGASALVAYKAENGVLTEVDRHEIPQNSTQGMIGW